MQINLQHSKVANVNLMQIIEEESTDTIYIQEPCVMNKQAVGIPKKYGTYTTEARTLKKQNLMKTWIPCSVHEYPRMRT
jgi:hypothetical protein